MMHHDRLFLGNSWLKKGFISITGTFVKGSHHCKLQHTASRIWSCAETEFSLWWMKVCISDNHYTTVPQRHEYYTYYLILRIFEYYIYIYIYIYIYTHTCTCTYTYTSIYIHKLHKHFYIYIYIIYIYIYVYVCIYVCITSDTRYTQNYSSYHSLVKMNQGKLSRVSKKHNMSAQTRSVAHRMFKTHKGRMRVLNILRKQWILSALTTMNLLRLSFLDTQCW